MSRPGSWSPVPRRHEDFRHLNIGLSTDNWNDFDNELLRYVLSRHPYAVLAFDSEGLDPSFQAAYQPAEEFTMTEMKYGWSVKTWIRRDAKPYVASR
jgi:hypothetical protein